MRRKKVKKSELKGMRGIPEEEPRTEPISEQEQERISGNIIRIAEYSVVHQQVLK